MKMRNAKRISYVELTLLAFLILYLIFPISTPDTLSSYIESPLGIIVLFVVAGLLFLYFTPLLAVLFIFFCYTLLRRSSTISKVTNVPTHMHAISANAYDSAEMVKNQELNDMVDVEQHVQSIPQVAVIERELTEGTSSREAHLQLNDTTLIIQPSHSLEEEIVSSMAPIGHSKMSTYTPSGFLPVSSNIGEASPYH